MNQILFLFIYKMYKYTENWNTFIYDFFFKYQRIDFRKPSVMWDNILLKFCLYCFKIWNYH